MESSGYSAHTIVGLLALSVLLMWFHNHANGEARVDRGIARPALHDNPAILVGAHNTNTNDDPADPPPYAVADDLIDHHFGALVEGKERAAA